MKSGYYLSPYLNICEYKHSKIELLQEEEKNFSRRLFFSLLNNNKSPLNKNIPKGTQKISSFISFLN